MTGAPVAHHSEIDEQFAVPGERRPELAHACAVEAGTLDAPSFHSPAWLELDRLDAADGFATRRAARAVLRRPSDGRFLIFRYPFRDGSMRFVVPGGGAEAGEEPLDALTREVVEETGTAPRELEHSGLLLYHLLASTIHGEGRTPTIQYSPVLTGVIDDELPDTGGREACWYTVEEFLAEPRRPISDPLVAILRASEQGERIEPRAVWLPA
ncbi:MAG: hydrolase [Thermoleophilia bacterium]|nr:hydrolase [Thermoleophilia bacterium]